MSTPLTRVDSPLRSGGGAVIGRGRTTTPGARAKAQERPLLPGQVRCDTCGNGVTVRADGSMRAHQAERYVSCSGAQSTSTGSTSLCVHGNYPTQRQQCCGQHGTTSGRSERPLPEHLRRFA